MANFKLNQTGEQIQADLNLLDSNSATEGQVLTANGNGGASWQNASGGGGDVEVVQTTGQSTTAVMSQKAVTDELAGKLGANKADVSGVGGLVTPTVAPLKQILVGIDTSNAQKNIPINEEDFLITDEGLSLNYKYGLYYLHTVVTSNYTFYFVNHYSDTYNPTGFGKAAFINSIAFNRYIGTNFRNKLYAFDLEIAISDGNNGLTSYRQSPTFIQKGNAISYFGNDGQEVTILASNFGTYVSDTVKEIGLF